MTGPGHLAARWRADAEVLRRRGAAALAEALESCAAELEAWERERALEGLTLEQAASESGYSYSRLQQLIACGTIPNGGEPYRPRIRRCDLPKKPGYRVLRLVTGEPDLAADILTQRS